MEKDPRTLKEIRAGHMGGFGKEERKRDML